MLEEKAYQRRGYVAKRAGFGGMIGLVVGIAVLVGGAGVAGLWYASSHGWDQPVSSGQAAPEPSPSAAGAVPSSFDTANADTTTLTSAVTDEAHADAGVTPPKDAEKQPAKPAAAPAPVAKAKPAAAPTPKHDEEPADPFAEQH